MINDLGIEIHGYEFINQPRKREVKSRFIKYNKKPKYLHKLTKDSLIISKDKKICGVAIINRDAIPDDISIQPAENGGAVNPFRLKELILDEKLTYNEYMFLFALLQLDFILHYHINSIFLKNIGNNIPVDTGPIDYFSIHLSKQ